MWQGGCSVVSNFGEDRAMADRYELRPLGHNFGTEALGINLSRPLDDQTLAWIETAFAEHPVLVFRDQNLDAGRARRVRPPVRHAAKIHALMKYRHAEHPEVSWLTNVEEDGKIDWYGVKRATDWHTDSPYEDVPAAARHSACEAGADRTRAAPCSPTCVAAYDALPEAMKEPLAGMTALHGRQTGPGGERLYDGDKEQNRPVYKEGLPGGRAAPGHRAGRSCSSTRCIRMVLPA